MSSLSSEFLHAALHLPPGALPEADFRSSGLPGWVLLESMAYMVNVWNETTAVYSTADDGLRIQVSFLIAEPPRLSYCCICCTNREENPFAVVPRIVASVEDLALVQLDFATGAVQQSLVYAARGPAGRPSLHLLPDFATYRRKQRLVEAYGLSSYDDKGSRHFVLAALSYSMDGQITLHTFRSSNSEWTKGPLQVDYGLTKKPELIDPTHVIALQDGELGWVDLWEGILICDVMTPFDDADDDVRVPRQSRFIPMPKPLPSNQQRYRQHDAFPQAIRDVAFNRGYFKCVELEQLVRLIPKAPPVVYDPADIAELYDSGSPMVPPREEEEDEYEVLGWRIVSWRREFTSDHWRRATVVHSDDLGPISWPHQLGDSSGICDVNFSFKDMHMLYPTLRGDGVVYLISIQLHGSDQDAWIVAIDTNIKSISKPIPFSADRYSRLNPTHISCVLTKYLDAKSGNYTFTLQECLFLSCFDILLSMSICFTTWGS
jgi:hypothetical protein